MGIENELIKEEELIESVHDFITSLAKAESPPPALQREFEEESRKSFDTYIDRIKNGINSLAMANKLSGKTVSIERLCFFLKKKHLQKMQKQRSLLQEELRISNQAMLDFYQTAFHFFENNQFEEASDVLLFLTALNPAIASFWAGLGMAEEQKRDYQAALIAYLMALDMNSDDIEPMLHCADCLRQLNHGKEANALLDMTMKCAGDKKEYTSIKQRALWMKNHA